MSKRSPEPDDVRGHIAFHEIDSRMRGLLRDAHYLDFPEHVRVAQYIVLPSLPHIGPLEAWDVFHRPYDGDASSWAVARTRWHWERDAEELCDPVKRLRWIGGRRPTIVTVQFDLEPAAIEGHLHRIAEQRPHVPANPNGLQIDGVSYELGLDFICEPFRLRWPQTSAAAMRPMTEQIDAFIEACNAAPVLQRRSTRD